MSVRYPSPFRYPGGKSWLIQYARRWLAYQQATECVEPFAGGASIALSAVLGRMVGRATLVELDDSVAAVWQTVLGPDSEWFIGAIGDFVPTSESVAEALSREPDSTKHLAFQTILRNRTRYGGILAEGARPINRGENGSGSPVCQADVRHLP